MSLTINHNDNNNTNCKVVNFYWEPIVKIISNIEFFCLENKFQNILKLVLGLFHFLSQPKR